jgi:hypothetical protein
VTVKQWLQQGPPAETEEPALTQAAIDQVPPPVPWSDWDQVRQLREALQEHRFLFLRRPENLIAEEEETVTYLLASPVGAELQVIHSFLGDWYDLWMDEGDQRRSLTDAKARFEAWRTNPAYQAVPPLKRVQQQMTNAKFEHLSQFLRHPEWEATNNGAERAGRAFRHRQAPHFNLRKEEFIEQAITVAACRRKETAMQAPPQPFHTCQRGRAGEQRYLLACIRKEVKQMAGQNDSKTIKAGSKTYFFDLKETKEGKPYLVITESQFQGEDQARERTSIAVFPDHAQDFLEATQEMVKKLG